MNGLRWQMRSLGHGDEHNQGVVRIKIGKQLVFYELGLIVHENVVKDIAMF